MTIDLPTELRKAARPHYDVGLQTYEAGHINFEMIGQNLIVANDAFNQLHSEERIIKSDEIGLDRQGMIYFRDALLDATEKLKKDDVSLMKKPDTHQPSIAGYLRPIFSMSQGMEYWDTLRALDKRTDLIPKSYLLFLPDADLRQPSRDDVIRALIPFKRTQREALRTIWDNEGISAIRISHKGLSQPALVLQ